MVLDLRLTKIGCRDDTQFFFAPIRKRISATNFWLQIHQVRQVRDVCIFRINGMEVYL